MSIEENTNKLLEDIFATLESFIDNDYRDIEKEFEDYAVRIYTTTDRNERIVEWDYVLKNPTDFIVDDNAITEKVYASISY